MLPLSPENQAALEAGALEARDFIWFTVRHRSTGQPHSEGYWSDLWTVEATVVSPTLGPVTRTWQGAGGLIGIGAIIRSASPVVQTVEVSLSQLDDRIGALIRDYDPRQGRVEVYRGLFDPATGNMVSPGFPRFLGFVDGVDVVTPAEGGTGSVKVTCRSHTQEFSRSNPATRSDADQRRRSATDNFYQDVSLAGELEIWWGQARA